MIRNVKRAWFEVWGNEEAQNKILKGLLTLAVALISVQSISLLILSLRKPNLIAVTASETRILSVTPPNDELLAAEVSRVASSYIKARHNWEPNKIDASFAEAGRFIHKDFLKKFQQGTSEQLRLAKEKRVSQRFYPSELQVDPKKQTVTVSGDRILIIDGLRATNPMNLELTYDFGPRTVANQEGVYITAEKNLKPDSSIRRGVQ